MAELDTSEREALLKVSRKVHRRSFIPVFFKNLKSWDEVELVTNITN